MTYIPPLEACSCALDSCRIYGCIRQRYTQPVAVVTFPQPIKPVLSPRPFAPHGCICPPGAEATCQGEACPRRKRHD